MSSQTFEIGTGTGRVIVGASELFLIAGPCVIESRDSALRHAEALAAAAGKAGLGLIFKASYDKANRTSGQSFRGPGPDEGLEILAAVRETTGLPLLTDVHETAQVGAAAGVVDVLQIPALLSRQTDLISAAASSGCAVNIKKGQFMAPADIGHALEKARAAGADRVMLTERGTSFGYGNLVNDFRSLEIMAATGAPIVFDATHSVQLPSAGDGVSDGQRQYVAALARAAAAVGISGLFLEVHEDPDKALSDGPNAVALGQLPVLLDSVIAIHTARLASNAP